MDKLKVGLIIYINLIWATNYEQTNIRMNLNFDY